MLHTFLSILKLIPTIQIGKAQVFKSQFHATFVTHNGTQLFLRQIGSFHIFHSRHTYTCTHLIDISCNFGLRVTTFLNHCFRKRQQHFRITNNVEVKTSVIFVGRIFRSIPFADTGSRTSRQIIGIILEYFS